MEIRGSSQMPSYKFWDSNFSVVNKRNHLNLIISATQLKDIMRTPVILQVLWRI